MDTKVLAGWANPDDKLEEDMGGEMPDAAGKEEIVEGEGGSELASKYGDVIEMLEAEAPAIMEQAEQMDPDMVRDPGAELDDDSKNLLEESKGILDEGLMALITEKLSECTWDDTMEIATHLEADGHIDDPELFSGFLFHLAHAA